MHRLLTTIAGPAAVLLLALARVRDFRRRKTVTVKARHRYPARPHKRRRR